MKPISFSEPWMAVCESWEHYSILPVHWESQRIVETVIPHSNPLYQVCTPILQLLWVVTARVSQLPPFQESCPWLMRTTLPGRLGLPPSQGAAPSQWLTDIAYKSPPSVDQSKVGLSLRPHCSSAMSPSPFCFLHILTSFSWKCSPNKSYTLESLSQAPPLGNPTQDTKLEAKISNNIKPYNKIPHDNKILGVMQLVMGCAF